MKSQNKKLAGSHGPLSLLIGILVIELVLVGCAYPVRNIKADHLAQGTGYHWQSRLDDDTLIIVTASGGGTRATALTLSTLRGLATFRLSASTTIADNIDVISSVSGGSVAAAYFALQGTKGLDRLERDFVRQDGISALLWSGLNPIGLARLSAPARERIDLLIDYLDRQLFDEKTFADLWQIPERPYLILNAGDMVEGTPFSFTQSNFNLLCSDLSKLKLSNAVAASAAFPVALSPITLNDYSPCEAEHATEWPPLWVENAANSDWYDNPVRVMRGRVARKYALGSDAGKSFVHLMDGGITDNLGESEPLRLLTTADVSPNYFTEISQGHIKRLIWIIINARSAPPSKLDTNGATPGIADMFQGTINSAIDSRTSSGIYELNESLREQWAAAASEMPPELAANFRVIADNMFLVGVDFEAIPDPACRKAFQSIPTSWTLSSNEIDALMLIGPALLAAAPDFERAIAALGAHGDHSPATISQACAKLAG